MAPDTYVVPDGPVPDGECNGGAENCSNGIDDNCNGLIDCADPVCQNAGYFCAAPPPSGWTGLAALATAAGGTIPSCGGLYAAVSSSGHAGLTASPANCTCACNNPPSNVQCNSVGINYYTDACVTGAGGASLPPNFCVSNGGSSVTHASAPVTPTSYNGDCTSNPSKSVPALAWADSYAACGYTAPQDTGGCTSSELCVGAPPFASKPCVWQTGDVACPGAPYTVKTTLYTSDSDTRDCSTCTCTASAGTCSATVTAYSAGSCTGTLLATMSTNGACVSCSACLSATAGNITANPGTCGNGGTGGAIGSASETGPVTVCCSP